MRVNWERQASGFTSAFEHLQHAMAGGRRTVRVLAKATTTAITPAKDQNSKRLEALKFEIARAR
jgi:hypothetical protein